MSATTPISDEARTESRFAEEIIRISDILYVRLLSGPDCEDAYLCIDDGEPDMNDLCKFYSHSIARTCAAILQAALSRAERADRLEHLVKIMLEEDPMEYVADGGVTMLDVWRKDARAIVEPSALTSDGGGS